MFDIEWLTKIFTNNKLKQTNKNNIIKIVSTDSRNIKENRLFIPLKVYHFDGHDHVNEAIKNGAQAIIWDQEKPLSIKELPIEVSVFYVSDTLKALQLRAAEYRKLINPKVIGITGSNGKTTTKDLLEATLTDTYMTVATKGNLNNHIGLPLTILNMKRHTEVLILEMGMSNFGEIELLSNIAKPNYAIITNIGESHIEHLGSRKGIAQAKLEIANGLSKDGLLIIDGDEPLLTSYNEHEHVIRCGIDEANDVIISDINVTEEQTTFTLDGMERFFIPLLGKHHALNASFVITLAKRLGMKQQMIQNGLMNVNHTSMRLEKILGETDVTIINDAYNASPTSMKGAINVVKELDAFANKVLVLGDVLELGEYSQSLHQSVAEVIEPPINVVYTYGEAVETIAKYVSHTNPEIDVQHFTNEADFKSALKNQANESTVMLFKASRGMAFEKFIEALMK